MEPFTTALSLIVGTYAVLFGWAMFGGSSRPVPDPAAFSEKQMRHIQEACQIHERWSDANDIHVACFDLFTILHTDEASFTGDVDLFAEVVDLSMEDTSPYVPSSWSAVLGANVFAIRAGKEKTRVIMHAWDYLNKMDENESYTKFLTPLIAKQRETTKLDCAAVPMGRAQQRGSGPMGEICGW